MKYILKKDLPFAKAGIISQDFDGDKIIFGNIGTEFESDNKKFMLSEDYWFYKLHIPQLISEGWIEEVKPREFYLYDDQLAGEKIWYNTIEEAKEDLARWAHKKVIKVREVIE